MSIFYLKKSYNVENRYTNIFTWKTTTITVSVFVLDDLAFAQSQEI